jgi:uncharacterized iron-regulated protein
MIRTLFHSVLLLSLLLATPRPVAAHILDLTSGDYISLAAMLDDLETSQVVFIGELHDAVSHHAAQLQVIRALVERGRKVAIGLEMFRAEDQAALDDWSKGQLEEGVFQEIYENNWSMWPIYQPIFNYARDQRLELVGLNIDREITRKISSGGFKSLSEEELAQLDGVSCDVDQRYQNYIRKALGSHLEDPNQFRFFCEAQMVWDSVMARHLAAWLERHPDTLVVVLAGSAHAWRYGLPEQLSRRLQIPYRILLPEVPRRIDRSNTSKAEADYLLLGVGLGKLH